MYRFLIRPLLFLVSPETVHHWVVRILHIAFWIPGIKFLVRMWYQVNHPNLETEVFGLKFPNKVGLAAGFDKKANLYNHMAAFGFGHVEIGTVNPLPQPGNPKPRLFRLKKDQALINRMGFNNPGVDVFVHNLRRVRPDVIIGGNIGKNTLTPNEKAIEDYLTCFNKLYDWVDYFVLNVSCPNVEGLSKLQDKDELIKIIEKIQHANDIRPDHKPVLLKIAPDLSPGELDDILEVVAKTGIDGIIATNTTTSRTGLKIEASLLEKIGKGGLSGKPLRNKSTETIRYLVQKSEGKVPVIGVGGIMTPADAREKIEAGASLVQIYTGFIYSGPSLAKKINKELIR